jgi:hypothetical protein
VANIYIVGICCYTNYDAGPPATVRILLANFAGGGMHHGMATPAHNAFIEVPVGKATATNWPPWLASVDREFYKLDGDDITFDPKPDEGEQIKIATLEKVHDANFCPDAEKIRDGYDQNPDAAKVAARIDFRGGPIETVGVGQGGLTMVTLFKRPASVAAPLKITATSYDKTRVRELSITDDTGIIYIGNLFFIDWFTGTASVDDEHHKYLYCSIFEKTLAPPAPGPGAIVNMVPLDTLGPGCSNTQWP